MSFFKRMGSASSSVRSLSIDQKADNDRPTSSKAKSALLLQKDEEVRKLNEQLTNVQVLLEQAQKDSLVSESKIDHLTNQFEDAQCENDRLLTLNHNLEERVESLMEDESATGSSCDVSESLKLKDLKISKLQAELQSLEDISATVKQRYTTKLKSIRGKYGKCKQEHSLKMFELKDQISELQRENEHLHDKLRSLGYVESEEDAAGDAASDDERLPKTSDASDGKSNIIIELASQISDQEYRISTLESQLEERDLIIAELQTSKLSPRNAQTLIEVEAAKASHEMQTLAKELKMLKRRKKKSRSEVNLSNSSSYPRELSSISRDSGAVDLSSLGSLIESGSGIQDTNDVDPYALFTPSHSATSFSSSSTLVI